MSRYGRPELPLVALILGACGDTSGAGPHLIERAHPAAGIERVVLRTGAAEAATVLTDAKASVITVSGRPKGGAAGYHPRDPGWKETPAERWDLDFVFKAYGPVLVISTKNEIRYIHHRYGIEEIRLTVPPGVEVVRERRELSGSGAPDLSEPGQRPQLRGRASGAPDQLGWADDLLARMASPTFGKDEAVAFFGTARGITVNDTINVSPRDSRLSSVELTFEHPAFPPCTRFLLVEIGFAVPSRPTLRELERRFGASKAMPRDPDDFASGDIFALYPAGSDPRLSVRVFAELAREGSGRIARLKMDRSWLCP